MSNQEPSIRDLLRTRIWIVNDRREVSAAKRAELDKLGVGSIEQSKLLAKHRLTAAAEACDVNHNGFIDDPREMDAMAKLLEEKGKGEALAIIAELDRCATVNQPAEWGLAQPKAKTMLAEELRNAMNRDYVRQAVTLARTGVGVYYGNKSEFAGMSQADRLAALEAAKKPGESYATPTQTSCVQWVAKNLEEGMQATIDRLPEGSKQRTDLEQTLRDMKKALVDSKYTGFAFCQPLIKAGWKAFLFAPDSKNIDTTDAKTRQWHEISIAVAKREKMYWGVPLSGVIENYRPTTDPEILKGLKRKATQQDLSKIGMLEQVPYFFGLAKAGLHVFNGTAGIVNEAHWAQPPTGEEAKTMLEETPLVDWGWSSGLVMVAPDEWPTDGKKADEVTGPKPGRKDWGKELLLEALEDPKKTLALPDLRKLSDADLSDLFDWGASLSPSKQEVFARGLKAAMLKAYGLSATGSKKELQETIALVERCALAATKLNPTAVRRLVPLPRYIADVIAPTVSLAVIERICEGKDFSVLTLTLGHRVFAEGVLTYGGSRGALAYVHHILANDLPLYREPANKRLLSVLFTPKSKPDYARAANILRDLSDADLVKLRDRLGEEISPHIDAMCKELATTRSADCRRLDAIF